MSTPGSHSDQDRSAMEQMSTAHLEELLLSDFYSSGKGADMGRLYRAAQLLAQRSPRPRAADQAWETFQEKYLPFADSPLYEDGCPPSSSAALGRQTASTRRLCLGLAAAALAVLLSVSAAAAEEGGGLSRMLAWWTDHDITLAPGRIVRADRMAITPPEEPGDYASLQEALADYGLSSQVTPRWLPEGFELTDLIVNDGGIGGELLFFAYYARDGDLLVINVNVYLDSQHAGSENYTSYQKDEEDPVPYEAGGVTHMLATNAGRPIALWASGPAECAVSGDITMEELKQMIDSIYQ